MYVARLNLLSLINEASDAACNLGPFSFAFIAAARKSSFAATTIARNTLVTSAGTARYDARKYFRDCTSSDELLFGSWNRVDTTTTGRGDHFISPSRDRCSPSLSLCDVFPRDRNPIGRVKATDEDISLIFISAIRKFGPEFTPD